MMEHIQHTVKRLCDWIDKHADQCGPENMEFASVVASTAQLAQIAAGGKVVTLNPRIDAPNGVDIDDLVRRIGERLGEQIVSSAADAKKETAGGSAVSNGSDDLPVHAVERFLKSYQREEAELKIEFGKERFIGMFGELTNIIKEYHLTPGQTDRLLHHLSRTFTGYGARLFTER